MNSRLCIAELEIDRAKQSPMDAALEIADECSKGSLVKLVVKGKAAYRYVLRIYAAKPNDPFPMVNGVMVKEDHCYSKDEAQELAQEHLEEYYAPAREMKCHLFPVITKEWKYNMGSMFS